MNVEMARLLRFFAWLAIVASIILALFAILSPDANTFLHLTIATWVTLVSLFLQREAKN